MTGTLNRPPVSPTQRADRPRIRCAWMVLARRFNPPPQVQEQPSFESRESRRIGRIGGVEWLGDPIQTLKNGHGAKTQIGQPPVNIPIHH